MPGLNQVQVGRDLVLGVEQVLGGLGLACGLALGGEHDGLEDVGILRDGLGNDVLKLGVEQVHIGHHGRAYDGVDHDCLKCDGLELGCDQALGTEVLACD